MQMEHSKSSKLARLFLLSLARRTYVHTGKVAKGNFRQVALSKTLEKRAGSLSLFFSSLCVSVRLRRPKFSILIANICIEMFNGRQCRDYAALKAHGRRAFAPLSNVLIENFRHSNNPSVC